MSEKIEEYIKNSYKKGMTKEDIRYNLLSAGYDINQIDTYLSTSNYDEKDNIDSGINENETIDYSSNTSIQNNNKEKIPLNSNKKKLLFFGIGIVLLFAVIASAFLFLGNDSPNQVNTSGNITNFKNEVSDNSSNTNIDVNKVVFKNTTSTPTNSKVDEKGFLTYDEEIDGIKIKYPKDWTVLKYFPGESFKNSTMNIISFKSPDRSNDYIETLSLSCTLRDGDEKVKRTQGLDGKIWTTKYDLRSLDGYLQSYLENDINNFPNVKIIDTSESTISSYDAKKITYTFTLMSTKLKVIEYIVVADDYIYNLRYASDVDDFKEYLETINKMIESFEIVQ